MESLSPGWRTALCALATLPMWAAALNQVRFPVPPVPAAFEANRGQSGPGVLFLYRSPEANVALTSRSVIYSQVGVELTFVGSQLTPAVRPSDPLRATTNVYSGPDPHAWLTRIPMYSSIELVEVYPGIDFQFVSAPGGPILRLVCRPGSNPKLPAFDLSKVQSLDLSADGTLRASVGSKYEPTAFYPAPRAYQGAADAMQPVTYSILGTNRFGFVPAVYNTSDTLYIEMNLAAFGYGTPPAPASVKDRHRNTYVVSTVADAAGKQPPFPDLRYPACGDFFYQPVQCTDVAVSKLSPDGELVYKTYLSGRTSERAGDLKLTKSGLVALAGETDSADLPITSGAWQPNYAGPPPLPSVEYLDRSGDLFAATIEPTSGALVAFTYAGSPDIDFLNRWDLGPDGSVYLFPKGHSALNPQSRYLPITPGALKSKCSTNPCIDTHVMRLASSLDSAIYATYLPGIVIATAVHSDGSLFFSGYDGPGFPVTADAYQKQPAGGYDGILARLAPNGASLIFGTYFGGSKTDWILVLASAPDGSVWATVSSFVECCVNIDYTLIHLDAAGSTLLYSEPFGAGGLAVDSAGNLYTTSDERVPATSDALMANSCYGPLLLEMTPQGERLFATYLPWGYDYSISVSDRGYAVVSRYGEGSFEVIKDQTAPAFAGCLVNAAGYTYLNQPAPGGIVTIFGSAMGPSQGLNFTLENGRAPLTLGGTRVLLNGEPIPILYSSYWQVNAILPYSIQLHSNPEIRVEANGSTGPVLALDATLPSAIELFSRDSSGHGQAAALNEDGSLNSPQNPARLGSAVMLFATGGGATIPASEAGEVTPLELRYLQSPVVVWLAGKIKVPVEFAGAAPGLLAGVNQVNIRLPQELPPDFGYPMAAIPLVINDAGSTLPQYAVTIAVR